MPHSLFLYFSSSASILETLIMPFQGNNLSFLCCWLMIPSKRLMLSTLRINTYHNNSISFYCKSLTIFLKARVVWVPRLLAWQKPSPGLAATWRSFCFSLGFPVSQQEGIRSKEEIEAWRQAFPPPTTPKNTILAKLSKAISNATPVCMRSLLKK